MAATLDTTPRTPLERELNTALHEVLDENEALKVDLAMVRGRLDALTSAFDADGTLGVLRRIAHDGNLPPELRVKAAAAAVPYEKPKLSVTAKASVVSLYDILEKKRLERMIEHEPEKLLDLDAEPAPTVLGHDGGPEPAA
jgi:hypothetical protein